MRYSLFVTLAGASSALLAAGDDAQPQATSPGKAGVLAVVNGEPVTSGELELLMIARGIPEDKREPVAAEMLDQLIERKLMQQFLASRNVGPDPEELDAQVRRIQRQIQKGGEDPAAVLKRLGLSEETLRSQLALPLAWHAYTRLLITPQRLREYFDKHRAEFDGTEIRASQIFLKADTEAERTAALERLRGLREEITAGRIAFADAAKQHSQAPTAEKGGDMGFFPFRGRMPRDIARAAFSLQRGQVSEPFASKFGVHLVTVTEVKPGDLSLEDVRREVLASLSDELWTELVRAQREKATIERKTPNGD
ncbi:MAG: peptidylprolyl isomerase [Planctomycetes bacterium]|nr:peptidylprolyl isomerase [Planctomycetota bacterium]